MKIMEKYGEIIPITYMNGKQGFKVVDDHDETHTKETLYYDDGSIKEITAIPKDRTVHGYIVTKFEKGAEKGLNIQVLKK
jgi:hypothetical protein